MRSKAIFMALLALAVGVQAEPVSQSDAASVARVWAQRNVRHHGRAKGRLMRVRKAMTHKTSDGTEFHSFRMQGGGTIITSADTENAPVIAFTPKDIDLSAVDPKSPLWLLLNRDISQRGKGRLLWNGAAERHRGRWSELRRRGKAVQAMSAASIANEEEEGEGESEFEPSDVRVPALVKSKWSQGDGIWNYYTPNCGDPKKFVPGAPTNIVCGCVATAMSQLMRYHEWPHSTTQITRQCSWAGNANYKMKLRTQAGEFDWVNMPFEPGDEITEEQCQAIGKLTSDAGISVYMMYNDIGADGKPHGESGAFSFDIPDALKSVWGYGSAILFAAGKDSITAATAQKRAKAMKGVLFSNFDAGLPVLMGISGGGGHQIVADGYGFDEDDVDYVHLNMGWSGQSDLWYNLPDIKIGESGGFTVVNDVVYNVMTNGTDSTAIISGRVTDEADAAVSNAVVTIRSGTNVVATAETSETGVWGVPAQIVGKQMDFSIRVDSPDGSRYGMIAKSTVKRPQTSLVKVSGRGYDPKTGEQISVRQTTVPEVSEVDNVGNSWGNDIVLASPAAQIVTEGGAVTNIFYTLDDALAAANTNVAVTIELLAPIELKANATVVSNCTVVSVKSSAIVTVAKGAALQVASGGVLALENVVITNTLKTAIVTNIVRGVEVVVTNVPGVADAELVTVAAGGTLELGKSVVLFGRITTEEDDGLVLAGELKSPVFLDCKASPEICQTFGSTVTNEEVCASATNIVNWAEETGEIVGVVGEIAGEKAVLRWGERPLALKDAVGYFVTDGGVTTNLSRRLDRLVARYAFADEETPIVLLADDTLSFALTLKHDLRFSAAEGTNVAVTVSPTACFTVPRGVTTTVARVTFMGAAKEPSDKCSGLFLVEGGDLTLGEGTRLSGLIGTSSGLVSPNSGAVNVMSGTVTLTNGAEIVGCEVKSYYNRSQSGYGGGVYLNGAGCRLVLSGGRITGCRAQTYGGGVYAHIGATVSLSGQTTVSGNFSGNKTVADTRADDIYMASAELDDFTLDGAVIGKIGVCWGESSTFGRVAGDDFITVTDGVDPTSSLPMFVCDVNSGLVATAGEGALKWETEEMLDVFPLTVVADDLTKVFGSEDPKLTYVVYGLRGEDVAENVLTGALVRAEGEAIGTYDIGQGTLETTNANYVLTFVGGTFAIVAVPVPPGPGPTPGPYWEVATNHPTVIAFQSINRKDDTEWALVVTNRVRYCNYRLLWTTNLVEGFVSTGDWEHVVHEDCAVWRTNVVTTGGAWFWCAEGADGTNMILHVEGE